MATIKLTKRVMESLQAERSRGSRVFDTELRGFGVWVYPSGKKTFFVYYGPEGKRQTYKIGPYGVYSVEQAREKAASLLRSVAEGQNPKTIRRAKEAAPTYEQWMQTYVDIIKPRNRTWPETERYLKIAREHWAEKPMDSLTVEDVERVFLLMKERGSVTANRFLTAVRACLQTAWRREKIITNPAMKVKHIPENPPRSRVLTDAELQRVLNAVANLKDPFVRAAFTMLIETGARRSEVLRAKWADFDLQAKLWRIPRPKSGRPQVMPLADSTVALLRNLPRLKGCSFIIPGRRGKKSPPLDKGRFNLNRPWEDIQKTAKIPDVHIHDIRRTFGLHVARKAGLHVASKLLRHSAIAVTERVYVPLGLDELRKAMEVVNEDRGKVLPMRPKAIKERKKRAASQEYEG